MGARQNISSSGGDVEDMAQHLNKNLVVKEKEEAIASASPSPSGSPAKAKKSRRASRNKLKSHVPTRRKSHDSSWLKNKAEKAAKATTSKVRVGIKAVCAVNRFSKKKSTANPPPAPMGATKTAKSGGAKKNETTTGSSSSSSSYVVPKVLRSKFTPQQIHNHESHFKALCDERNEISVTDGTLLKLLASLGERTTSAKLKTFLSTVDMASKKSLTYHDFLHLSSHVIRAIDESHVVVKDDTSGHIRVSTRHGAKHQFSKEETAAFSTHINQCLAHDKLLCRDHLPLDPNSTDLFVAVRDGILLAKLINEAASDTIDERAINVPKKGKALSIFEIKENQNLVIESAKAIGCKTVGVHNSSLIEGPRCPHLVLGLVWQIVKIQLMSIINLKQHPELVALLKEGEELHRLLSLSPEAILLRWVNYHLKAAGSARRIKRSTFSADVKDSEIFTVLLHQINPAKCDAKAMNESDVSKRAKHVIRNAKQMGVSPFIKPRDILSGNRKLNFAFLAQIFNEFPGLKISEKEAFEANKFLEEDDEGTREERVFRMWMNSLNIEGLHVQSLFEDCRDGIALLKTLECIQPGVVNWKSRKVNKRPKNKYHRVENTNMCVALGREKLDFSLVGISGADLERGNHKLTLALVWQMLRMYQINLLTRLGGGKKRISEKGIRVWANEKVKKSSGGGSVRSISSFQDRTLRSGHFLMAIIAAMEPRAVNWDFVGSGSTKTSREENAKYVITCARKIGAVVFLTFEDIVEVKPKMILLLLASLMAVDMGFDEVDGEAEDIEIED
eukprot:g2297.t1